MFKTYRIDGKRPSRGLFYTICYHLIVCNQHVEVYNIIDMVDFVNYFKKFLTKAGYLNITQVDDTTFIYSLTNKTLLLKEELKI